MATEITFDVVTSLPKAVMTGLALFASYLILTILHRVYFSPLAKFPGPKLAALTGLYETYYDVILVGQYFQKISELHDHYGPIVRISPNEIHIRDSSFFEEVYAKNPTAEKPGWEKKFGSENSVVTTSSPVVHRQRRAALSPMFSRRSILNLQTVIRSHIETLSSRITEFMDEKKVLVISDAFPAFTGDIIMDYFFGFSYDQLKSANFDSFHQAFQTLGSFGHIAALIPGFYPIMNSIPDSFVEKMQPAVASLFRLRRDQSDLISRTLQGDDLRQKTSYRTIFEELTESRLAPEEKSHRRLADEAQVIVSGGVETTAWTLSVAMFYIVNDSKIQKKLHEELVGAFPNKSVIADVTEYEKLPYLMACIHEALRLSYGFSGRNPRSHAKDLQFKQWTIPAGTVVTMSVMDICHDENIFPDSTAFIPERWLNNPRTSDGFALEHYFVVFGKGPRSCLGINLAWVEMYLLLGVLFRRFTFELYETNVTDTLLKHDFILPSPKLDSKGIRVLVDRVLS